jgi:cytochrome c oxidase assembly protein subunit 15
MPADVATRNLPSPALRRFAWGFLAYSIAVILWGTIVRATGSGAGCGDHWPLCDGTIVQHSHTTEHLIEFIHRITSGLSLVGVVVLAIWTWRTTERAHLARLAVTASLIFMILEAILGALLVVLGLTAQSQSPMRAPYLALHLTNTLLLIASLTLTAHLLSRRKGFLQADVDVIKPIRTYIGVLLFMIVGVSGSLAALGDTLFPAETLTTAFHADFADASNWLIRWRWTHPTVAILASIFLLWLLSRALLQSGPGKIWKNQLLTYFVLGLLVVEYILGALNVALLAPVWMQVVHLLTADLLWVALVVLTARLTLMPRKAN